jgi:deoxyribodipyrimidine photo-lyase
MKPIIVWFRRDLRLADNPALLHAARSGRPLICLYVLDDETPGDWKMGGATRWWLHHSLGALDGALKDMGGGLALRRGRADAVIETVIKDSSAEAIVWNRCYEPFAIARDKKLKENLKAEGIAVESFNASLLFEPWEIATQGGKPFRVFTPFWRALRERPAPGVPHPAPRRLSFHKIKSEKLSDWDLLPIKPNWATGIAGSWVPGEAAARRALSGFLDGIEDYAQGRDIPGRDDTSCLSPHLASGEIGPRQIWHAVRGHAHAHSQGAQTYLKELGWREFCYQLLFHNPKLPEQPFDPRFGEFPWRRDVAALKAWQKGRTGIPIVDAGMRQLWQTGWMHNRVRMIVASLLIKHLGIHWREGENWFWDTLVDADLANNAANWQWVAGSGADAAPFFRIFNPVLQGEKFDSDGAYVRRYVPELKKMPDKYLHRPWDAPAPPPDYPGPIVDLAHGRDRALKAFKALKKTKP